MNPLLIGLLVALALLLATNRRQLPIARTLGEIWEPARVNGWVRGTAWAIAGLIVFALLFIGSVGLVIVTATAKMLEASAFFGAVLLCHLLDLLLNPPPQAGR